MHFKQVMIRTGAPLYGDEARQMVASRLDGVQPELVSRLMNYEGGELHKTRTGFPLIHFAGAKDGFAMVGFGAGIELLDDALPIIHQAISVGAKRPVLVEARTGDLTAESRPYPMRYRVQRMVVQKKQGHRDRLQDQESGTLMLQDLFVRSLRRQAEVVGVTLPTNIEARFLGAEGQFAARNGAVAHMGLRGALFDVNVRLGGLWSVGYLLSKGYGSFNASMQLGVGVFGEEVADAVSE